MHSIFWVYFNLRFVRLMIFIDNRTGSKELYHHFQHNTAQLTNLDFADFMFVGNGPQGPVTIAIERKVMSDLISSMTSGRLSGYQIPGLLRSYNYVWLVIEGIWQTSQKDSCIQTWTRKGWQDYKFDGRFHKSRDIIKYLLTISIKSNIRVWFTSNSKETVNFITALFRWWTDKEYEDHRSLIQEHEPIITFEKPTLLKRLAKELDGVGSKKAGRVSKMFNTPLEMCLANEKVWMEIEGIGKKLAKNIVKSLQERS